MTKLRFKIVVPSYNSVPWIENTLSSIEKQTYPYYDVCVIDDASTDPRQQEIIQRYHHHDWTFIRNDQNMGALANIVRGIDALDCEDEDVIAIIDGDDWLFNEHVLQHLADEYNLHRPLVTYGRAVEYASGKWIRKRVLPHVSIRRSYRKSSFLFDQLRTFKYSLWKHLPDQDLRDLDGAYFDVTYDMAIMFPLLEMAGSRICHVRRILYVINDQNPIRDHKVRIKRQKMVDRLLRSQPKRKVVKELK